MGTVVGELGKQQSNDFSKIQARFANWLKLTHANVADVIQQRLLKKNDEGVRQLSDIYHGESNNFKTLFDFAEGSQTYRNFQDREHFIRATRLFRISLHCSNLQSSTCLSTTPFEGKHSSVGERSMLGVFQQVAIKIDNHEIGSLATFDLMFEGIRTALKSQIQRAIIQAEHHLEYPFAIRLLKALFLVKYVKEFKSTIRNLCVLMLDGFNRGTCLSLESALKRHSTCLEQQTYVQRNGELSSI